MIKSLLKDKKGIGNQLMLFLVMGVVLILIILLVFIWQLVGPPLVSTVQTSNTIIQDSFATSGDANLIAAGQASFQPAADSLNNLEWVSYTIFVLMFLTFIVMCFYVRTYPFLLVFWILIVVVLLIVSIYMAVVYQDLRVDPSLGTYYTAWENTDFMLRYLPGIVLFVGLIGGIVMLVISNRDQSVEYAGQGL